MSDALAFTMIVVFTIIAFHMAGSAILIWLELVHRFKRWWNKPNERVRKRVDALSEAKGKRWPKLDDVEGNK